MAYLLPFALHFRKLGDDYLGDRVPAVVVSAGEVSNSVEPAVNVDDSLSRPGL